jgi:hypothetical protein
MAIVSVSRTSITDEGRSRSLIAVSPATEELGGMVLLTPTSIASTGTGNSSSIGANGSVTFSACETLSLNGVFSATYDNYMVVIRGNNASATDINYRLRVSGSDNSTASSYTSQYLQGSSTTVSGGRVSTNYGQAGFWGSTQRAGLTWNIYGPFLAQPTALRTVGLQDSSSAATYDIASTHNQSTSYDGFTIIVNGSNGSGLISVYGLKGA